MTFDTFSETLEALENYDNFYQACYDNGISLADCNALSNLESAVVKILEETLNDVDGWVAYWCWDLDFGRDWHEGIVTEADGTDICLETMEDLWDLVKGDK